MRRVLLAASLALSVGVVACDQGTSSGGFRPATESPSPTNSTTPTASNRVEAVPAAVAGSAAQGGKSASNTEQ